MHWDKRNSALKSRSHLVNPTMCEREIGEEFSVPTKQFQSKATVDASQGLRVHPKLAAELGSDLHVVLVSNK